MSIPVKGSPYQNLTRTAETSLQWEILPRITVRAPASERGVAGQTAAYVAVDDPEASWFKQISKVDNLSIPTVRRVDWFWADSPSEFWNHFAGGSVLDPRVGPQGRFKCQQCALAWWDFFRSLAIRTGDEIWRIVQREIAFSALADLDEEGRWHHGFWRSPPETHARFQADGILLLTAEGGAGGDEKILQGAQLAAQWTLQHLTDKLAGEGLWFLHDTLEISAGAVPGNRPLGASPGNTVCLNTHLRMLLAFQELLHSHAGEPWLENAMNAALAALDSVLSLTQGTRTRSVVERIVTSILVEEPRPGPWHRLIRAIKVRGGRRLAYAVRTRFPAIHHPAGYLDRDLDRSFAGAGYHVITLKDLLLLHGRRPIGTLPGLITKALHWALQLDLGRLVQADPMTAEFLDSMLLFDRLISPINSGMMDSYRNKVLEHFGALPLDTTLIDLQRYPGVADMLPART